LRRAAPPFVVEYHHDPRNKFKFKDTTPDDEWLSKVGAEGWIVFSHDRKWHVEAPNIEAIKQHRIGCFYLWGANASTWEKLKCFMRGYDRIAGIADASSRPFIYELDHNGRLTQVTIP
jgi:hypothetical protein